MPYQYYQYLPYVSYVVFLAAYIILSYLAFRYAILKFLVSERAQVIGVSIFAAVNFCVAILMWVAWVEIFHLL